MVVLGNSGLEYIVSTTQYTSKWGKKYIDSRTAVIKNITSGGTLFSIIGRKGKYTGRGTGASKSKDTVGVKKFLGLDNKYYYMEVTYGGVDWGQIQPNGAVLRPNRTILTNLAFYPQYKESIPTPPTPVPIIKIEPISAIIPAMSITPPMNILPGIPIEKMGDTWINQLMNQINNQIYQIIQSILNFLKLKT